MEIWSELTHLTFYHVFSLTLAIDICVLPTYKWVVWVAVKDLIQNIHYLRIFKDDVERYRNSVLISHHFCIFIIHFPSLPSHITRTLYSTHIIN